MLRATSVIRKPAVKASAVTDTVVLSHDERQRRRVSLTGQGGLSFLLDLDKVTALNDGDALKLEDGRLVAVQAAPQALLEIRAENPLRLMRVAWHIGNRHTPAEITADAIYIEDDHVLAEMIRGQGCLISKVMRAFKPERGAYDQGHAHGHDHGHAPHGHGHAHGHDHDHGHAHDHHAHDHHAHAHGDDCGCGHDHHHGPEHTHDVLKVGSADAHAGRQHGGHDHGGHDHGGHKHHHHDHDHGHHHHGHDHGHAPRGKHDH